MMETFRSQQETFLKLRSKLCQAKEKRIVMMNPEWSQPAVSEAERAEFYALFRQINARGVYYDGDCSFRVAVWSTGFAGNGDYKGYSYKPLEYWRGSIVDQPLDTIARGNPERLFASRALGADWYLYFQHWP